MNRIKITAILVLFFIVFHGVAMGDDNGRKIIVNCEKSARSVHAIIIGDVCYIYDSQNISAAIAKSGTDPKNIQSVNIFKEGGSDVWKKFSPLLEEFEGRISTMVEVVIKTP